MIKSWTGSRKAEREFEHAKRVGLTDSAAEACAEYVFRVQMTARPARWIPRWRCKFGGGR